MYFTTFASRWHKCTCLMLSTKNENWHMMIFPGLIHWTGQFFLKNLIFWGHQPFLWGHWYPYFGLLVIYTLGFKARVYLSLRCFLACVQWIPQIHLWYNNCWPLDSQYGIQTFVIHIPVHVHALVELEHAAGTLAFFSKLTDFRPIRWIRRIGQNHPHRNSNQLKPYTNTENILV